MARFTLLVLGISTATCNECPPTSVNAKCHAVLNNVSRGTILSGIGGMGSSVDCSRYFNPDCSTLPVQMVGAVDFALDPTGRYLYIATMGLDSVGSCVAAEVEKDAPSKYTSPCLKIGVHDNSSRLIRFDLHTRAEPTTLSYCGPWRAVEYDAKRRQVIALRHADFNEGEGHGRSILAEVVAFDADVAPARDERMTSCRLYPGIGVNQTCACSYDKHGSDPSNLNGKVIGRGGLERDVHLPAATMTLLGNEVLVGDQNNYCVRAFPLDGSAGSTGKGRDAAGTCGKSCGQQGCASVGKTPVPAGKLLGTGDYGHDLTYELFTTPDGRLYLQNMNTETIDYGRKPEGRTQYKTVPIDDGHSSVYHVPTFHPSGDKLLVLDPFSYDGYLLKTEESGTAFGRGKKLILATDLEAVETPADVLFKPRPTTRQGLPVQWAFTANGTKLLALIGYAPKLGGKFEDHAFVEFDL